MKQQVYEEALKRIVREIDEAEALHGITKMSVSMRSERRRLQLRAVKDIATEALRK